MGNIVDPKIGDLFIQKGFKRVFRENGEIVNVDYVSDIIKLGNNYNVDNSGIDCIYQLYGYDMDGYKIRQFECFGFSLELDNMSLEEINNRFISLSDFLKDATFVGREFRRTKPICRDGNYRTAYVRRRSYNVLTREFNVLMDKSYMGAHTEFITGDFFKSIVLYMKDNIFLVRKINRFGDRYEIIGCNYTCDGNYEFYGPVYEEYMDRDKVYSEIVEQIDGYNKKGVKTRIKIK